MDPALWFAQMPIAGRDAFLKNCLVALISTVTLAAVTLPEQMATARLGGFSPEVGLIAFVAATVGFVVAGASRVMTVGADSTITPVFATLLISLSAGTAPLSSLGPTLAVMVGILLVLAGMFRLGWIGNLLSVPVMTGFLVGVAVHIAVSQLSSLAGLDHTGGGLLAQVRTITALRGQIPLLAVGMGLSVLAIVLICEVIDDRLPGPLIGLFLATVATSALGLDDKGITTIGAVAGGFSGLRWPDPGLVVDLVPTALIIALLVMMQTALVSRTFATDEPDVDRDFLGAGIANTVAGLAGAFPVNASPPRTSIVADSAMPTQLPAVLAAALTVPLMIWGGALIAHIPHAALAGVLLAVARRLFRIKTTVDIARRAPWEGGLVMATALAVIVLPIETGAAIGVGLSLLHSVYMVGNTRPISLLRIPGSTVWWPAGALSDGEAVPGVLVLAFQAPIFFANGDLFRRGCIELIDRDQPLAVVLECTEIAGIDYTAGRALEAVIDHCRSKGIRFAMARLESMRAEAALSWLGLTHRIGAENLFRTADEAVRAVSPSPRS